MNESSSGASNCVSPSASFAPPTPPVMAMNVAFGMSAEHVFFERADDVARRLRAVLCRKSAHERNRRFFGRFTHHENGCGCDRIGAVDECDLQFATVDV